MTRIIGIDPGVSGAIAILDDAVTVHPMPTIAVPGRGKARRSEFDEPSIVALFEEASRNGLVRHAFIERAYPMPKQGSVSGFNFGCGWGILRGILAAFRIPYTIVSARTWQKVMITGIPAGDRKSAKLASVLRAKQLFSSVSLRRTEASRKDDDGMAEALLIAEYGRRQLKGGR